MKTDKKTYLFILPGILGFMVFYLIPYLTSIPYMFFERSNGILKFGFGNIVEIMSNQPFLKALVNTALFLGLCIPLNIVLPMLLSLVVNKNKKTGKVFLILFLLPIAVPSAAVVFFWKNFFAVNGFLNHLLAAVDISPVDWLNSDYALFAVIVIYIWKNAGYNVVLFLGGLLSIPQDYYEYAVVEGAGKWQQFRYITFIYIQPALLIVFFMTIINSFKVFREIYLIAGSYPHDSIYMLQHYLNNMFSALNYPKLTVASNLFTVMLCIITSITLYLSRRIKEVTEV